ncbi:MAG: SLBB domain-containing protein [Nitrospirae bacterium]|nr:SLBB domain-containing protein [Candidatus Troglogloeales bacterium]
MSNSRHVLTDKDILLYELPTVFPLDYKGYIQRGGYQALTRAVNDLKPSGVLEAVLRSGLFGRGGAGFPTAKKWQMVLSQPDDTRYLCCNGAEDEPGTFKDRYLLRSNPHQLIEGAAMAAFAIGAQEGYLYINGTFDEEISFLNKAIDDAREHGHLERPFQGFQNGITLKIVKSPGTYVAGEETALLEVIEGREAKPKQKPPYYPAVHGLFGKPTLVNNLETICNIPHIVRAGGDFHKKMDHPFGTMIFSLTGDVRRKGLYELPLGTPIRVLIEEYGGGIIKGGKVKGFFPGGPSNAILPGDKIDLPLDLSALKAAGSSLGTGSIIVMSEENCMVQTALLYADFFAKESCGQCPPCHLGLANVSDILRKIESGKGQDGDIHQIEQLCEMIKGRGYCYLLTGGVIAVESILLHFRKEFETHIEESKCRMDKGIA